LLRSESLAVRAAIPPLGIGPPQRGPEATKLLGERLGQAALKPRATKGHAEACVAASSAVDRVYVSVGASQVSLYRTSTEIRQPQLVWRPLGQHDHQVDGIDLRGVACDLARRDRIHPFACPKEVFGCEPLGTHGTSAQQVVLPVGIDSLLSLHSREVCPIERGALPP